ncbi:MAG: manganese catalase family protein [Erysipelotrichales bacterium]|nr:manganese catalase family protein [Erysipelotrichales bacterium]
MWTYSKKLQYPVSIKSKDLAMAKYIITQFGGSNGELGATLRYLTQRYTMPDDKGKALLTDIGTEELAHMEMISAMVYQLTKDATIDEIKAAGLEAHYTEHGVSLYPTDANGVPFTVSYFAVTGDPVADLAEDMAAEQKARATYENLMNLTNDPDLLAPLSFLRQREIIHFERFKELYEEYVEKYYQPDMSKNS